MGYCQVSWCCLEVVGVWSGKWKIVTKLELALNLVIQLEMKLLTFPHNEHQIWLSKTMMSLLLVSPPTLFFFF